MEAAMAIGMGIGMGTEIGIGIGMEMGLGLGLGAARRTFGLGRCLPISLKSRHHSRCERPRTMMLVPLAVVVMVVSVVVVVIMGWVVRMIKAGTKAGARVETVA